MQCRYKYDSCHCSSLKHNPCIIRCNHTIYSLQPLATWCTRIMPHSCITSPHPGVRLHRCLFQSPQSINRNTQHSLYYLLMLHSKSNLNVKNYPPAPKAIMCIIISTSPFTFDFYHTQKSYAGLCVFTIYQFKCLH